MMFAMKSGTSWCVVVKVLIGILLLPPANVVGRTVSVATLKVAPYIIEDKDPVTGKVTYDGFIKELLDGLSSLTKTTYKLYLTSQFGEYLNNGTWTGLMGELTSGRAQMGAAPLTMTADRNKVVDFSVPFQHFGPVIVLKRITVPPPTFFQRFRFVLDPMEDSVWLMSLVAYFVVSVVLYVICYVNPYEWRHLCADHQATRREAESFTCVNTFWFVLSTWTWQGYIRAPRSLGGRVVVTVWWMYVLVFLLTYTASLTNLLRVGLQDQQVDTNILSLEDLAAQDRVDFGFVQGGSTATFLKNSQLPHLRQLWSTVRRKGSYVKDLEDGIGRVRNVNFAKPFAFITESAMAHYMLRQKPCDLYMVGDLTITGSYGLAYKIDWDLKNQMDFALLQLQENGSLRNLKDKWFSGKCPAHVFDPRSTDSVQVAPFYSVNVGSFSGVLVILSAGVVVGAIITIFEIIIFRIAEKNPDTDHEPPKTKGKEVKSKKADLTPNATETRDVTAV